MPQVTSPEAEARFGDMAEAAFSTHSSCRFPVLMSLVPGP